MTAITRKKYYTVEEYLKMEVQADFKSEYYTGEIFAMAGGTLAHSQIAANVITGLGIALRNRDCIVCSSDLKVRIDKADSFVYPDATVICGAPEYHEERQDIITNPTLIVEVLSPSTAEFDRHGKFMRYMQLDSLQEYVLIDARSIGVETFKRQSADKWLYTVYRDLSEQITFESIEALVPMSDVYMKVIFEAKNTDTK